MAAYDPTDPYNWKQIAAELDAQKQGQLASGGTPYTLPSIADDPEYIAYLQQDQYGRDQAEADTKLRKQRSQDDYNQALIQLEQQGLVGRRNTDTSLLSRGVFNSGEAIRRRDELGKALAQGREQADVTLSQNQGDIDADKQRALTTLDMERERQIAASKARIAATQNQGRQDAGLPAYASMGPSSTASAPRTAAPTQTAPRQYTLPAAPAGTLPSSNESGVGYSTAGTGRPATTYSPAGGGKPMGVPAFSTSRKPKAPVYSKPKVVQY